MKVLWLPHNRLEKIQDAAFRNETCEITEQKGILRDYILPLLRTPPVEGAIGGEFVKKTELIDSTKETIESSNRMVVRLNAKLFSTRGTLDVAGKGRSG